MSDGSTSGSALDTSLGQVSMGRAVTVVAVEGEGALVRRLAELGIRVGATVTALHRTAGGGRVIEVAGGRIALAHKVLRAIATSPVEATTHHVATGVAVPSGASESGMPA